MNVFSARLVTRALTAELASVLKTSNDLCSSRPLLPTSSNYCMPQGLHLTISIFWHYFADIQCKSKNPPPEIFWKIFSNGWEFLVQILHAYYRFLSMLEYKSLFSYLQLWRSYAILSATTIMCSICLPSTEKHAGWSHLIWHNFVIVGDNWIKIYILAYVWTFNRCVKFGLKIPNCLGKMSENASVRFGRWWHFVHMIWTGWSRLIWHNFVKVSDNWIKIRSLA